MPRIPRTVWILSFALFVPLTASAPPQEDPIDPMAEEGIEVEPELKEGIDDAIRRGVNWLKERQNPDGSWPALEPGPLYPGGQGAPYLHQPGLSALALLALLKCEVPPDDPVIENGFAWLRANKMSAQHTYEAGVFIMALDAKVHGKEAVSRERRRPRRPSRFRRPNRDAGPEIDSEDKRWMTALVQQILGWQHSSGGWRYGGLTTPTDGPADVSATQYALLGLGTAVEYGIEVDPQVFVRAAEFLLDQQQEEGPPAERVTERLYNAGRDETIDPYERKDRQRGWSYIKGHELERDRTPSGGMTCAGIVGVTICRQQIEASAPRGREKEELLERCDQSIFDGLAWLDAHYSTTSNPPLGNYELGYYLYALERVGILTDLRFIGPDNDWYVDGARYLVGSQTSVGDDQGYWRVGQARPPIESQETPYALLFLRKAGLRMGYAIGRD